MKAIPLCPCEENCRGDGEARAESQNTFHDCEALVVVMCGKVKMPIDQLPS